jgi:arylformamidase
MKIHPKMAVYKNRDEKRPKFTIQSDFNTGSSYETRLDINLHTGTHIDAPLHMIKEGEFLDSYPLERFITLCKVFDFRGLSKISANDLQKKKIEVGDFILLKTDNSESEEFDFNFTFLEESGAKYLRDLGISGVGIDALGIERNQADHITHKTLLGEGIIILEGLRLGKVSEGNYYLIALPLKIEGVEAGPTRAVLIDEI